METSGYMVIACKIRTSWFTFWMLIILNVHHVISFSYCRCAKTMRAVLTSSSWWIIITAWTDLGCMPLTGFVLSYMGSGIMTGKPAGWAVRVQSQSCDRWVNRRAPLVPLFHPCRLQRDASCIFLGIIYVYDSLLRAEIYQLEWDGDRQLELISR